MNYQGVLTKMKTELGTPIQYYLVFKDDFLNVNQLLDKKVKISFVGYQCLNCQKRKKIYRQGYCYDCFYEIPQAADWIMHPELSKAHLNIEDRDLEYEKKVQLKPHIVYLANASKGGVIRTLNEFEGVVVKGVGKDYDWNSFNEFLIDGNLPDYTRQLTNEIVISEYVSNRLKLKVGDKVNTFFFNDNNSKLPRSRSFEILGIYNSCFKDFDEKFDNSKKYGDIMD